MLVPLIETVDDARRWTPTATRPGSRSAGGVRPLLGGIAAMLNAGAQVAVGLMIETVTGVENAAAIAAQPGVDYLLIGTGDLALSRGTSDPDVIARDCARVLAAAREQGLPCGIYTGSAGRRARPMARATAWRWRPATLTC